MLIAKQRGLLLMIPAITKLKSKIDPEKHLYPPMMFDNEDDVSVERNISLLRQEVSKPKPNVDTITSLMGRTFTERRQWILDNVESVQEIVEKYPFLSKSTYVRFH